MEHTASRTQALSDEWCAEHFDHLSVDLAQTLPETMARVRGACPVAHSDAHGGFWVLSGYDPVVTAARDWESFTSTEGLAILSAHSKAMLRNLPVEADPPEQRIFKNLTNPFFTPSATEPWTESTRALVTELVDGFIERGSCDFMDEFARPYPSRSFFQIALGAPEDQIGTVSRLASTSSVPNHPRARESWLGLHQWIKDFVEVRRSAPPRGDVVDAILAARVGDRAISDEEIYGTVQLLILGGLETTAGALGLIFLRFCRQPEIPALLREQPEQIPKAIQELLRLDSPFVSVGRTATRDVELHGRQIKQGDKVLLHWASANRDPEVFDDPDEFRLDREHNRHVAFGMGVHRCTGNNLARFNIRIALEETLRRMPDLRLAEDADLRFHAGLTRSPLHLPITFTPGPRSR